MGGPRGASPSASPRGAVHAGAGAVDIVALQASLAELMEEQRREAEALLARHQDALRQAVGRALAGRAAPAETREPPEPRRSDSECSDDAHGTVATPPTECASGRRGSGRRQFGRTPSDTASRSAFIKTLIGEDVDEEPPSKGTTRERLFEHLNGTCVETFMGVLILLNTIIMYVQLEFEGRKSNSVLERGHGEVPPTAGMTFEVFAHFFTVVFLVELVLKLCVYRGVYFHSAFNVFDFAVVVITTIDLYVVSQVNQTNLNVSFLRTMRMLRLARLFRVVRTMELFQKLRVLMKTIVLSFMSILWSMMILFIFMLVSSLLLCQLLQEYIVESTNDDDTRRWVNHHYGTSTKALYTIFEATFSGCWPNYARPLIDEVSVWYAGFFVLYVTFVVFTLIRIIYALLLKDTLQAAANDADQVVREKMMEQKSLKQKLSDIFAAADVSGDGFLNREEFADILAHNKVKTWMGALGIDAQDSEALFDILDDGSAPPGNISWEEFVNGIMRMKGQAHRQDLLCNARDTHRILAHCEALRKEVSFLREPGQAAARVQVKTGPRGID